MKSKIERVGKPEEQVKEEWKSSKTKTCYIITVHSSLANWRFDVCDVYFNSIVAVVVSLSVVLDNPTNMKPYPLYIKRGVS